jgi:hypothetical protein
MVLGWGGAGLLGGGGGPGEGKGTPDSTDKGKTTPTPPAAPKKDETPKKDEKIKPPDLPPMPGDVRVIVLSGDEVKENRFYLIQGETVPKTFTEFRDAIEAKRKAMTGELTLIFRFRGEPLSGTHPAIQRLEAWLREAKLNNRFE